MNTRIAALTAVAIVGCGNPSSQPAATPEAAQSAEAPSAAATPEPAPDGGAPAAAEPAPTATEQPPASAASSASPPQDDTPGSPLQKLMRSHFRETEVIRNAVINGNITAAVEPARLLVNLEGVEKLPVDWKHSVQELQAASRRIGNSPDVPATAAATADIGVACGECHAKVGGPKAKLGPAPPEGDTIESRMARHAWATERLWEGLFVPSDAAWKAGAQALHESPIPKEVLKPGGVHARSASSEFATLAAKAPDLKTPEERAKLYASLIGTCASCHMAVKGK